MKIDSFAICDNTSNLTSVDNIITVSCLFALYITRPLNKLRTYLYKLFQSKILSIKEVLLTYR
jgi:hypothetical protein